jgi:hypothetical protein
MPSSTSETLATTHETRDSTLCVIKPIPVLDAVGWEREGSSSRTLVRQTTRLYSTGSGICLQEGGRAWQMPHWLGSRPSPAGVDCTPLCTSRPRWHNGGIEG